MSGATKLALLRALFLNEPYTGLGDAGGLQASDTVGSVWAALHTDDPSAGDQTTNEANYTGYGRVSVPRTSAAWQAVQSGNNAVLTLLQSLYFPQVSLGGNTVTYVSFGISQSGTGRIIFAAPLTQSLIVGVSDTPYVASGGTYTF